MSSAVALRSKIDQVSPKRARAEQSEQSISVFDNSDKLVFEFFPDEGRAELHVPAGDLKIRAGGEVSIQGDEGVSLKGRSISLSGLKGLVDIEDLVHTGKKLRSRLESASLTIERLDSRMGLVNSQCRQVHQKVDELLSVRAGRLRQKVTHLFMLRSSSANIKTEKDLTLDGKEIRLG